MRLNSNSLLACESRINTNGDRVLNLRSLQIPLLEHLDILGDIHEVIDLTDNDLRILGNFPLLIKLRSLLIANNRITSIQRGLAQFIPQLESLSLISNNINSLSVLEPLKAFKNLHSLYLSNNGITNDENYRSFVVWLLPQLTVLDFQKIKQSERSASTEKFGTFENPSDLAKSILNYSNSTIIEIDKSTQQVERVLKKLTNEEREILKEELKNASSLAEIDRIENTLKNGYI